MRVIFRPFLINILILGLMLILSVGIGTVFISPSVQFKLLVSKIPGMGVVQDWSETYNTILLQIRLPHTLLIALAGSALASSGAAYQGLFRNPLADPYLIGVASGAGLAAVIAISVGWPTELLGLYGVPAAAFIGALITVFIVYSLARMHGVLQPTTLILAGVAVSSFATALTSFIMLRSTSELRRALAWLLGGALMPGWEPVLAILPYLLVGITALLAFGHTLNVLQFGDEQAQQLGIPVEKRKMMIIVAASLTTAAAVAFAGIIGFIGLIVPHIVRMLWGSDYRQVIFLSIFAGSSVLLFADLIARVALAPQVMPVGIITAMIGAPFFLWVLLRTRIRSSG